MIPAVFERPLIQCPICEQQMKRITATHLKKHNMTMDEFRKKYGEIVAPRDNQVLDLSDPATLKYVTSQVLSSIVQDGQIDDNAKEVIQNLLQDQGPKLRVSLNMVAVHRIHVLEQLLEKLTAIQMSLLSERRLAGMSDANLAKTYQIVERSVENILDYLKSLSVERDKKTGSLFEQTTNVVNVFANDRNVPEIPNSPAGREKIRALFSSMMQRMQDGSLEKIVRGTPALVEPLEVTVQESVDEDKEEDTETANQEGAPGASEEGISAPG